MRALASRCRERAGCELYLKLENLQMTGSFKERGALNKLAAARRASERAAGVIAASAGNHAQGLAFVAQRFGVRATIVMPVGTPLIKVSATRAHGAERRAARRELRRRGRRSDAASRRRRGLHAGATRSTTTR